LVTSGACTINANTLSLGNDIDQVVSMAPDPMTRRAYHLYYYPSNAVSNSEISNNRVENYVAGGSALCGIYITGTVGGATWVHCAVSGNHIRGSNLSIVPSLPCAANEFPYEFSSHLVQNAALHIYCVAQNCVVVAENAGAANFPSIYFADVTTQEPLTSGTPSCFATNRSPAIWW